MVSAANETHEHDEEVTKIGYKSGECNTMTVKKEQYEEEESSYEDQIRKKIIIWN